MQLESKILMQGKGSLVAPKKKAIVVLIIVFALAVVVPCAVMSLQQPIGWAVGSALCGGGGYAFWALCFSCPRCGAPLLWEVRNNQKIVRLIPMSNCSECGFPLNKS